MHLIYINLIEFYQKIVTKIIYESFKTGGNIFVGLGNLSGKDRNRFYDSEKEDLILRFY